MSYKISKEAERDLRAIGRYSQQTWGKDHRQKYLQSLDQQFHFLAANPLAAIERREFKPTVRIRHHSRHLIVYVLDGDNILIVRVLHESMDIAGQLGA